MRRPLYLGIGGLCLLLAMIIASEFNLTISDVAASPSDRPADDATGAVDQAPDDVDTQIASILDRPLFAPNRRGPPAPKTPDQSSGSAGRAAPEITGRLGGITIGPGDDKEAVFERGEGEKPLVVKEGDDVDGWTVSSIEPDKVVLTSTFGHREIQPTFGDPTDAPLPRSKPSPQKEVAGADLPAAPPVQPPPAARRVPPRPTPPAGHPFPGMNPRQRNPASNPAMRR
jgi:hypothetical protein